MKSRTEQEDRLARYLLGTLSPEEGDRIEEQIFADDQLFEQLLVIEDALIDAYVQDELPPDEREGLEAYLASSPRRIRDLSFTRDLIGDIAGIRPSVKLDDKPALPRRLFFPSFLNLRFPAYRYALVGFLLVCGLCVYLVASNSILSNKIHQLRETIISLEKEQREPGQVNGDKNRSRPPQAEITARLALSGTSIPRGRGGMPSVALPSQAGWLQIQIEVGNESGQTGYLATVATAEGEVIWRAVALMSDQPEPGKLDLFIPVERLEDDLYTLKLERLAEDKQVSYVGEYAFRIMR